MWSVFSAPQRRCNITHTYTAHTIITISTSTSTRTPDRLYDRGSRPPVCDGDSASVRSVNVVVLTAVSEAAIVSRGCESRNDAFSSHWDTISLRSQCGHLEATPPLCWRLKLQPPGRILSLILNNQSLMYDHINLQAEVCRKWSNKWTPAGHFQSTGSTKYKVCTSTSNYLPQH